MLAPKPYPLCWPDSWPRTSEAEKELLPMSHLRVPALIRYLHLELNRLDAKEIIVSMAAPLQENGGDSVPGMDSGVAVWWRNPTDEWFVLACDVSRRAFANLTNVLTCASKLREFCNLPTWQTGSATLLGLHYAANQGYTEYGTYQPPPGSADEPLVTDGTQAQWWHVLGFSNPHEASLKEAEKRYRQHARKAHPDLPTGSEEAMRTFNEAIEQARKHFARQEAS